MIMWACHFSRFGQVVIYDKSAHMLYLNLIFQKLTITCGSSPVNSHKGEAQFGGAVITRVFSFNLFKWEIRWLRDPERKGRSETMWSP